VRAAQDLRNAEGLMPVGSTVKLTIQRNGASREVSASLAPEQLATLDGGQLDPRLAGVSFSDLSMNQRSQGMYGVAVTSVRAGSRAALAGLQQDDVVVGVGNARITGLSMLRGLAKVRPRQLVLIVASDEGLRYVVVD